MQIKAQPTLTQHTNFHQLVIIFKENHDNLVGCNEPTTNNSGVSRDQINMLIFSSY